MCAFLFGVFGGILSCNGFRFEVQSSKIALQIAYRLASHFITRKLSNKCLCSSETRALFIDVHSKQFKINTIYERKLNFTVHHRR